MSCDPAGLAELSRLTSLTSLTLARLGYREPKPAGGWIRENNQARLEARVWQMIKARKAGKPLPAAWLTAADDGVTAAERTRQIAELERQLAVILAKIKTLQASAAALAAEVQRRRASK